MVLSLHSMKELCMVRGKISSFGEKACRRGAEPFVVHAEVNGRKNEAPVGAEDVHGSEEKFSPEAGKGEQRS